MQILTFLKSIFFSFQVCVLQTFVIVWRWMMTTYVNGGWGGQLYYGGGWYGMGSKNIDGVDLWSGAGKGGFKSIGWRLLDEKGVGKENVEYMCLCIWICVCICVCICICVFVIVWNELMTTSCFWGGGCVRGCGLVPPPGMSLRPVAALPPMVGQLRARQHLPRKRGERPATKLTETKLARQGNKRKKARQRSATEIWATRTHQRARLPNTWDQNQPGAFFQPKSWNKFKGIK